MERNWSLPTAQAQCNRIIKTLQIIKINKSNNTTYFPMGVRKLKFELNTIGMFEPGVLVTLEAFNNIYYILK